MILIFIAALLLSFIRSLSMIDYTLLALLCLAIGAVIGCIATSIGFHNEAKYKQEQELQNIAKYFNEE